MEKKYIVRLTEEERRILLDIAKNGKESAKKITHARMLLEADISEGQEKTDAEIAKMFHVNVTTVHRLRVRLVEEGFEEALNRKVHSRTRPRKLDGEGEACLIATSCSEAPGGRKRWTLRLLASKLVELKVVDSIAPATVYRVLKKTN